MDKDRKLNWRQACVMLGCGKTKFYELIHMGRLPATKVGKKGLRVSEAALKSIIEEVGAAKESENANTDPVV
jgi:DNA binding domain, excisionase family